MRRIKGTMSCVAAAIAAVGFPGVANADAMSGTYAIAGGADGLYATFTPSCATDGCTASIVSNVGWTSVATMSGGRWNFNVTKPDGIVCEDGSYAPVTIKYSIDPVTLTGTLLADSNGDCPGGQITQSPLQLKKLS